MRETAGAPPANHLDLATKEMLVDALKDFEGTLIFISHDDLRIA
jgi:ATPase subunit of ABC transporter with duplicated ATPase domains